MRLDGNRSSSLGHLTSFTQASSDLGVCFCSQTGDKALMQEGKTAEQNYKKDQGNNAQFGKDEMSAFKGVRCTVLLQTSNSVLCLSVPVD